MNTINTNEIYFAKATPNAIIPSKREEDAGYDLYACFDEEYMIIPPHTTKLIPTNIHSAFSNDYVLILKERGSNGVKGIAQRCGVIDSGYRNAIFVPLTNTNEKSVIITKDTNTLSLADDYIVYPYSKAICQALLVEVPKVKVVEKTVDEILAMTSERGTGHLGSSGK